MVGMNNEIRLGINLINLGVNSLFARGLDIALPGEILNRDLDYILGLEADIGLAARGDYEGLIVNTAADVAPGSCDEACFNEFFAGFNN